MRVNKQTGAPARYLVVKEETGLSKKGASRHFSRQPKKSPPPPSWLRPTPRGPASSVAVHSSPGQHPTSSPQARCPGSNTRSCAQNDKIRVNNANPDVDDSSNLDQFQEAHYNAYREEYKRRPGDTLVLHPHQMDASQDPYIYRPEETAVDKVLAELDKFDLYDTIDAIATKAEALKKVVSQDHRKESAASKAAESWRNSLEERPPILTSHRDAYSYHTRGQQALSPKSSQPAQSLHKLEGNIAETSADHTEDPGPVPTYGFYPPTTKKNLVYVQSGVKQSKKALRVTKGDASIGCLDTGVCNTLWTDFPGVVDVRDANSLDGKELGELENQHARQAKVERTWAGALQSTIRETFASKDDRVSAVDTLRTEFNQGTNDYSGFRRSTQRGGDDGIDRRVAFGRNDPFAGSTAPTAPNPLWHLLK